MSKYKNVGLVSYEFLHRPSVVGCLKKARCFLINIKLLISLKIQFHFFFFCILEVYGQGCDSLSFDFRQTDNNSSSNTTIKRQIKNKYIKTYVHCLSVLNKIFFFWLRFFYYLRTYVL